MYDLLFKKAPREYEAAVEKSARELAEIQARLEREVGSLETIEHRPVGMDIPARMIAYFSACENPGEYTGRLFFAERELADMGIEVD